MKGTWAWKSIENQDGFAIGRYYQPNDFYKGTEYVNINKDYGDIKAIKRLMFLRNVPLFETSKSVSIYLNDDYTIEMFCKDTRLTLTDEETELGYNSKGDWMTYDSRR